MIATLFAAAPILKVVGMAAVPLVIAGGLAAAWHVASSYGANKVMVAQYARIAAKNRVVAEQKETALKAKNRAEVAFVRRVNELEREVMDERGKAAAAVLKADPGDICPADCLLPWPNE